MVFVDDLGYLLFALGFAGFMLLYTMSSVLLTYKRRKKDFTSALMAASVPLFILGIYMFICGLWGQSVWPLPGSYNILFYDPLISFAIILMAFGAAMKYKTKLEYVGFFGLIIGITSIFYGVHGYLLNMTSAPLAMLGLYTAFGLAGIFSYPAAMIVDRLSNLKAKVCAQWTVILALLWIFLLVASIIAIILGSSAIPMHLMTPP